MGKETEEKNKVDRDEKLDKLVQLSKEIILRFVTDKYNGKISPEHINEFIDNGRFFIDSNQKDGIAGTYHGWSSKPDVNMPITFSKKIFEGDLLEILGTIIHEIGHKFSAELSTGPKLGKPIEEGFADIFSEECINYFLRTEPETLITFASKENIDYDKTLRYYSAKTDYNKERSFSKMVLEAIRQTTGMHYHAESQYILGDKNKFLEIVRETLGDEGVELILQQERDDAGLSSDYDESYNERLSDIILERVPLNQNEFNDIEDGTYNIYDNYDIRKIADRQKNREYLRKCTSIEQIRTLSRIQKRNVLREFEYLMELPQFELQDVLQIIGNADLDFRELELVDEQLTQLTSKILKLEPNELGEEQIKAIAYISFKTNEPNEELFEMLKQIESAESISQDTRMDISIAKIKNDKQPKGQKWTSLLEKYCAMTGENRILENDHDAVYIFISDYFQDEAKDDPDGLKCITDFLKSMETTERNLTEAQSICLGLKQKYSELLNADIMKIKTLIDSGEISIENNSINTENLNPAMLLKLASYNKSTKMISVFNEGVITQFLRKRCCENVQEVYNYLNEDDKNMYLTVLNQILQTNESGIRTINDIKGLCDKILSNNMRDGSEKKRAQQEEFVQGIRQVISKRENPISDLMEVYKIKIPRDYQFIYDEIMANFESKLNENNLGEISEEQIKELALIALNNTRIQDALTMLLDKKYTSLGLTTEQFVQTIPGDKNRLQIQMIQDREREQHYLKIRTEGYMRSIGKDGDEVQQKVLMRLQEETVMDDGVIKKPQFIKYKDLRGIDDIAIIGIGGEGQFVATTLEGNNLRQEEEIKERQNKGKKGIKALFKKKREREPITETRTLSREGYTIQVLNRYDTGRLEIVSLDTKKARLKMLNKEDTRTTRHRK